jgi:hypothetical protein
MSIDLPHEADPEFKLAIEPDKWTDRYTQNRKILQEKYAYTLPTREALDIIVKYKVESGGRGFLELGAGKGYWAMLLKKMGCNIIATDVDTGWFTDNHRYTEIVQLDAIKATKQYPDRTLIIMYPHDKSTWPIEVLPWYKGEYIILVMGDGCATEEFWGILSEEWEDEETIDLTHWPLFPTCMTVYKRKPQSNLETEILTNIHNRVLRLELQTRRHGPTL